MRFQPKQKLMSLSHKNHQIWGKYLRWLKEPWTTLETPDCNPIQQMAVYSSSRTGFSSKTREMVKCLYSPQLFENNSDTNWPKKNSWVSHFTILMIFIWRHIFGAIACAAKRVAIKVLVVIRDEAYCQSHSYLDVTCPREMMPMPSE